MKILFLLIVSLSSMAESVTVNVRAAGSPSKLDSTLILGSGNTSARTYSLSGTFKQQFEIGGGNISSTPVFWDRYPTLGATRSTYIDIFDTQGDSFISGAHTVQKLNNASNHFAGVPPVDLDNDGNPEGIIWESGEWYTFYDGGTAKVYKYRDSRIHVKRANSTVTFNAAGKSLSRGTTSAAIANGNLIVLPEMNTYTAISSQYTIDAYYSGILTGLLNNSGTISKITLAEFSLPKWHYVTCLGALDIDGDTADDVVMVTSNDSSINIYPLKHPMYDLESPIELELQQEDLSIGTYYPNCAFEDLNNDGLKDLLFVTGGSEWRDADDDFFPGLIIAQIPQTQDGFAVDQISFYEIGDVEKISLSDLNGDGITEVFASINDEDFNDTGVRAVFNRHASGYEYSGAIQLARGYDNHTYTIDPFAIPGVKVLFGNRIGVTDLNGQVTFDGVLPGTYPISLEHGGFELTGPSQIIVGNNNVAVDYSATEVSNGGGNNGGGNNNGGNNGGGNNGGGNNGGGGALETPEKIITKFNKKSRTLTASLPSKDGAQYVFEFKVKKFGKKTPKKYKRKTTSKSKQAIKRLQIGDSVLIKGAYSNEAGVSGFTKEKKVRIRS